MQQMHQDHKDVQWSISGALARLWLGDGPRWARYTTCAA